MKLKTTMEIFVLTAMTFFMFYGFVTIIHWMWRHS